MRVTIGQEQLEVLRKAILENSKSLEKVMMKAIKKCWQHERSRPEIVCLCGSSRFGKEFASANLRHTLAGRIVLSIGCNTKSDLEIFQYVEEETKQMIKDDLDELHLCKIDLADRVHVINVGGYIGESTEVEIAYAMFLGKRVSYLEN